MSTKAIIRFAEREEGVSFSEHPEQVTHQIYHHYDGYPEFLGVALAEFINEGGKTRFFNGVNDLAAQVLTHLKLGIHYGKCSIDGYNIWTKDETNEVWISIFDYTGDCIFVGLSRNLIFKYKLNTNADG
jgi:hypothetical protein